MKQEYCIKGCEKELDNEHLSWCMKIYFGSELKYEQLSNGTLQEKVKAILTNFKLKLIYSVYFSNFFISFNFLYTFS